MYGLSQVLAGIFSSWQPLLKLNGGASAMSAISAGEKSTPIWAGIRVYWFNGRLCGSGARM
jgi:hypothetical protein